VRVTCSQSSNGDAFVNFTVGSKFVWVDRDAKDDPAIPGDASKFLNGATPPAYAAVKDSDLSTSDVTTNNVSTTKHGFTPKAPNDVTKFLDGGGSPAAFGFRWFDELRSGFAGRAARHCSSPEHAALWS